MYTNMLIGIETYEESKEAFREMKITDSSIKKIHEFMNNDLHEFNKEVVNIITFNMLLNHYSVDDHTDIIFRPEHIGGISYLKSRDVYKDLFEKYNTIFHDIKYFPVPEDITGKAHVSYENSWSKPRSYGGKRVHEGTDIMASNNEAGYFPVISVSDGMIEEKGWLEQGGYRIGVRSESGAYFYYAHLSSYNDELKKGEAVTAGTILGFMGNTGYSKIVGTTGKFDVHLHFGLYLDDNGKEMSVNPYWVLKYLEDNKLSFKGREKKTESK